LTSARALRRLLIVEPDPAYRDLLQRLAQPLAKVEAASDFQTAYSRLYPAPPDLLITKLRLYSKVEGLQLAYVVASAGSTTRTIVYGESAEEWVTRELQRLGAFYEPQSRLQFALPAYVQALLPVLDRRDPMRVERRMRYRGGRRGADVPLISAWGGGDSG
jgi:DNA-binding NtrC family response regulator